MSRWIQKKSIVRYALVIAMILFLRTTSGEAWAVEPLSIKSGDRIVLVGPTFIERDLRYGCIETVMTAYFHEYDLTFRNLGWSGDNVFGIARASFDSVLKGYERLINQVNEAKPTIVFMSYGQNESFKGAAGLDEFIAGYTKLLDDLLPT